MAAPTLQVTDVNGSGSSDSDSDMEHEDQDKLTNGHLQIGPEDDDDDLASVMSED